MRRRPHGLIACLIVSLALTCLPTAGRAADSFIEVGLPQGVRVDLPRNFQMMSDNRRITLDAAATATADTIRPDVNSRSRTPFAALLYADDGIPIASTNIRYFPEAELTQGTVKRQRDRVAEVVDPGLRKGIERGISRMGLELTNWQGTDVRDINGLTALVTRYQRADTETGSRFQVRLIRVYAASRTFFITFSYRLAERILMEPIAERVTRSVRLNRS